MALETSKKEKNHQVAQLTLSLISSIRERLNPEFLFSDLMALMAPDLISIFACSVAIAVSTTGWSDKAAIQVKNWAESTTDLIYL